MAGKEVSVLLLLAVLGCGSGGKVLVWPADNSHWLNMEHILQELVVRGHEVTVLLPSCFLILNPTQPSPFQFEVIEVPITKKEMAYLMDEILYFFFYEERELPIWKSAYKIAQKILQMKNITKIICDGVVKNEALMERLRASTFDVLLADPLSPSGELVAEKLGIPFVYTFRFSMGNTVERLCGTLPAPPSYVPTTLTSLTDRMTFWQRLKNILSYTLQDFIFHYVLWASWDQYYSEVLVTAEQCLQSVKASPASQTTPPAIELGMHKMSGGDTAGTAYPRDTPAHDDFVLNKIKDMGEKFVRAAVSRELTGHCELLPVWSDQSCTWNAEMLGPKFPWLLWVYACCCSISFCGRVVVWPTDASHWINVKVLLQELVLRGHEVTVLVPSSNLLINYQDTSSPFTFEVLQVPFSQETLDASMEDFLNFWMNEASNLFPWEIMWTMKEQLEAFTNMSKQTCDTLVMNSHLIAKLQQAKFDVLIADPLSVGGELVAEILEIPFVYSFRFSDGNVVERLCGGLPSPPSYVPASTMGLTHQMSFMERLQNFLFYIFTDLFFVKFWRDEWDGYYSNVLGRPTTLCETMGKAEIWLIRTYWDFEFPRPFLPNFEFVGGLHCQPAKPLPKEMEEFVQSSGEHGIIVFTLGSMVYNLSDEKSNVIAKALSQLPQKVLWRYKGKKPETLGSNTKIYDWIPQNDLLGHPLTKAFITHGGTNGLYEAIYHGIPMVGIPMFADQHDNIAHMVAKGAAVQVDFNTMKTQDLVDALNTVIYNSTYKENALKLSKIQHDQPVKPLDRAVFWIEFVMRHKGAKHLRPAAHHLTWYQYHSLDVLAFLFTCKATIVFILFKCCLCCCRRCGRIAKRKKE
ncbi:hypothetical protein TURU_036392 [Turdus rufiventris]|nr:hypothetical protein TURU_036392 [Turdus rufiventris]